MHTSWKIPLAVKNNMKAKPMAENKIRIGNANGNLFRSFDCKIMITFFLLFIYSNRWTKDYLVIADAREVATFWALSLKSGSLLNGITYSPTMSV